ncbi:MAG: outer membrane lipoprotein-sorting protein [Acidobacteriaceae bacterium]
MKHRTLFVAALTLAAAGNAYSQAPSPQLTFVLKQLDTASAKFQRATADFQWDYYEKVVHDTSTQKGSIYFEREKGSTDMGAVLVDLNAGPKSKPIKVIQYQGGLVQIFDPGVDQITVLHEAGNQAEIESFLTLGFGGSGTDLARAWNITDQGPETLTDNGQPIKVEKLDLVGKDADARKNFTHITIWVDPARAVSLKQIFYTSSGDYRTATYSAIKVNGNVHKDQFAIKKDKNTTTINH